MTPSPQPAALWGCTIFKTRKAGDLILVDVHIEVPGELSVRAGHAIALAVRENVLARHEVLQVMIHIDPYEAPGGELAHA